MEDSYPKYTFTWLGGLVLFAGLFAGTMVTSVFNVFWMFVFKENLQYRDWFFMLANASGFLAAIAFFDFFIVRRTTGRKLNFNFSLTDVSTWLLIFPMMAGMMFIAEFITSQIPTTGPFFGKYYEFFTRLMENLTDDPAVMVITAVICAPIFEEIIFRGIIQKGMINAGVRPWKSIAIASVIFGLVHGNPWQFVGAVLLGAVLGTVYYKTKSLLLPMLLHGFNNLCSTLLMTYTQKESFAAEFHIPDWAVLAAGMVLFSLSYYLFTKKYEAAC